VLPASRLEKQTFVASFRPFLTGPVRILQEPGRPVHRGQAAEL
jgi:hypothetical protein